MLSSRQIGDEYTMCALFGFWKMWNLNNKSIPNINSQKKLNRNPINKRIAVNLQFIIFCFLYANEGNFANYIYWTIHEIHDCPLQEEKGLGVGAN